MLGLYNITDMLGRSMTSYVFSRAEALASFHYVMEIQDVIYHVRDKFSQYMTGNIYSLVFK